VFDKRSVSAYGALARGDAPPLVPAEPVCPAAAPGSIPAEGRKALIRRPLGKALEMTRRGRVSVPLLACALALALGGAQAHAVPKGTIGFLGEPGSGSGAGQFITPRGVAVNQTTGHVYVVDSGNHRIQQFSEMGTFVRAWGRGVKNGPPATGTPGAEICETPGPCVAGTAGSFGGEFNSPQGIAIGSDGSVYVTDQGNRRVQKFSAAGLFERAWGRGVATGATTAEVCLSATSCRAGTSGTRGGEFGGSTSDPFSGHPAVNPDTGNVVVADPTNERVQEFDTNGAFLRTWGWDVQTGAPAAFEVCSVATSCKTGSAGSNVGRFSTNQPTRVAVDSAGAVYAVEGPSGSLSAPGRRVQKFGPSGGSPPLTPSAFADGLLEGTSDASTPWDVAVDPVTNNVLVVKGHEAPAEYRILELTFAGDLVETHLQGGEISSINGIGIHGSGGRVFVSSTHGGDHRVLVLGAVTPPSATIAPVTDVEATTATFHGTVNPNGGTLRTRYHFEYSDDGGLTWVRATPPDPDVGNGTAPQDVHLDAEGLEPNTAYRVRLVASRPLAGGSATSAVHSFTTLAAPPDVSGVTTREVTDTTAILVGAIDANRSHTTYRFEYGTDTGYGSATVVDNAGSGPIAVSVSKPVTGLQPNTTYHFRLVATNAAGETPGTDQTFTTAANPPQPSGRAYEMVSPLDKNNGDIDRDFLETLRSQTGASASGDAVAYISRVAFGDLESGTLFPNYLARRGAAGWTTEGISPPISNLVTGSERPWVLGLSLDLSKAYVRTGVPVTPDASMLRGSWGLYRRNIGQAERYTLLSRPSPALFPPATEEPPTQEPTPPGTLAQARFTYIAETPDSRHVVFNSARRLLPGAPADASAVNAVYEWVDGSLRLASVLPDGLTATQVRAGRRAPGGGQGLTDDLNGDHLISDDGRRVFFTATLTSGGNQLFVRENGTSTEKVSASQPSGEFKTANPDFWAARATDGSVAFFSANGALTPNAATGPSLYRWDANASPTARLTEISKDIPDEDEDDEDDPVPAVQGPAAVSDDARTVYFVARGVLDEGGDRGAPKRDALNLYVYREGQEVGQEVRYIETLDESADDMMSSLTFNRGGRAARVSADGDRLLFASYADLDPSYDTTEATAEACGSAAVPGERCRQIYVYDFPTDDLRCLTCVPGVPVTGDANLFGNPDERRPSLAPVRAPVRLPRNLTPDGRRAFFETARPLVSADRNSQLDVYEWADPDRDGQGELRLISPGRGASDAKFLDASVSGDDVFFTTREQLVGIDTDNQVDLYDARVGGGIPAQNPPPVVPCQGEDCQGGLSGAPSLPAVGSGGASHGNLRPRPRPAFRVLKLSRKQLARLARGKRVNVRVRVNRAGRVRLAARAELGRRMRPVASASKAARRAGTVRLGVKLADRARRVLARRGRLNVRLSVTFTGVREPRTSTLRLRRAPSTEGRGAR
jgi:hypothetical protein